MLLFTIHLVINGVEFISKKVAVIFFEDDFLEKELASFQKYYTIGLYILIYLIRLQSNFLL